MDKKICRLRIVTEMRRKRFHETVRSRIAVVTIACAFALYSLVTGHAPLKTVGSAVETTPTPRRTARSSSRKYSQFPHDIKGHALECGSCHKFPSDNWKAVRVGDAAFPDITDYPKHDSCIGCHRQQFFKGTPPTICSICHTSPGPRNSSRHPFPNPRELFDRSAKGKTATSDFVVSFPHDKHVDIVSQNSSRTVQFRNAAWTSRNMAEESCGVCHQTQMPQGDAAEEFVVKPPVNWGDKFWLKKGAFKTAPTSHTTCFTCHSTDTGIAPAPTDCAVCHKLRPSEGKTDFDAALAARIDIPEKTMADAWRRRQSSGTFRHEWFSHAELACATCHNVSTLNTAMPATAKIPVTTCATCHATATTDDGGALNYEIDQRKTDPAFQCVKCHLVFGKSPVPESHIKAVIAAGGKP